MAITTINNRSINRSDTASADQVWTATSATAADFQDAAGGAHTLLQTQNASNSASIAFSSTYITSTYRDYMVVISGMLPATDNQKLKLYISSDNGSAYKSGSGYDYASRGFDSAAGTSHTAEQNGTTGFQLNSTNASNEADSSLNMVINIFHPLSTTFAFSYYGNGQVQDTADDTHVFQCSGYYDADHTDAINNIKFQMASGNITSGQFRLYGIT